jgi:hypothetical protein
MSNFFIYNTLTLFVILFGLIVYVALTKKHPSDAENAQISSELKKYEKYYIKDTRIFK